MKNDWFRIKTLGPLDFWERRSFIEYSSTAFYYYFGIRNSA